MWAWGIISPQLVQHIMTLFKEDLLVAAAEPGMSMTMVDTLAGLGSNGQIPGNIHRDLLRRLPRSPMPSPHSFKIDLKHSVTDWFEGQATMILPHELFASIYHHYRDAFFTYILPGFDELHDFWECVKGLVLMVLEKLGLTAFISRTVFCKN